MLGSSLYVDSHKQQIKFNYMQHSTMSSVNDPGQFKRLYSMLLLNFINMAYQLKTEQVKFLEQYHLFMSVVQ